MAFICEKISKKDREYFDSLGFTCMRGKPSRARWWAIDRERDIVMICRGGVPYEITKGYQLYFQKCIINIEAIEKNFGNRFDCNIEVRWDVKKVQIPKEILNFNQKELRHIIEDAFIAFSYCDVKISQVKAVIVNIDAL